MLIDGIDAIRLYFPGIEMQNGLPHSLPVPKQSQSMVMFQQVVSKSFQIIKTILPKVNSLFQLNQELERSVSNIERKLTRLQYDNQNLHYEMRTNHLTNENRYNAMVNDYLNINNQASVLKKQAEILAKSVKEVKHIHNNDKKEQEEAEVMDSKLRRFQERTRKIIFQDEIKPKEEMERAARARRKNSIELKDQDLAQNGKVRFNLHSNISIECSEKNLHFSERQVLHSQNQLNRKSNLKPKKNKNAFSTKKIQPQHGKFQEFLREIENYHFHNQMIKKNYEKLMDEYCSQNALQFQQVNKKIEQLSKRMEEIDPNNNLKELLDKCSQLDFAYNLEQFKTEISNKVNSLQFNHVVKDLNTRLTKVHEMIQKFANREQTQKAIMLLQHKINNIYEGDDVVTETRRSVHHAELQKGSLRIVPVPVSQQKNQSSKQDINVQTLDNTPRTYRFDHPLVSKKNIASLHASLSRGNLTQTRKGSERMSLFIDKQAAEQETTTNRRSKYRELHLLKQKSIQILEKGKTKVKPKLKKERLIFQYD